MFFKKIFFRSLLCLTSKLARRSCFFLVLLLDLLLSLLLNLLGDDDVLAALEGAHELVLLLAGLEAAVADLGGGVDELELDLLERTTVGGREDGLTEGEDASLGAEAAALDHEEVVLDKTVVGEAAHGGDGLLGEVELSVTAALVAGADTVDLLVHLGTVVVAELTSAADGPGHAGRMPGTDTADFAETTVGLAGKAADAEALDDALSALALGAAEDIDGLVHGEDAGNADLLLEEANGKVDLLGDRATVDLDLHDVGLLLADGDLVDLSVGDEADHSAVLDDALEGALALLLAFLLGHGLGVVGEGFLLAVVPVLVEATTARVGKVVSPDRGKGAEAAGGLDVTDKTDSNHGGSVDDGDGLEDLLLVGELGLGSVDLTDDVGHAGLVAHEGSEMAGLGLVILGEGFDLAAAVGSALAGTESEGTVTGCFVLAVRHLWLLVFFVCVYV